MKRTGFLVTALFLLGSAPSFGSTVQYTLSGELNLITSMPESTFLVHIGYDNLTGEVNRFELSFDGSSGFFWTSSVPGAELEILNDVPNPYSSLDGIAGDVFNISSKISTSSHLPTEISYDGIGISLTDSTSYIFGDTSPPLSLSFDQFDGGLVPGYLATYGNALYSLRSVPVAVAGDTLLWGEIWDHVGTITSGCGGYVSSCQQVAVSTVVPIPTALQLFAYGLIGIVTFGRR